MARDRQRAKQRKARRAAQNPGPPPSEPHRTNVPGELDHASGDADEFEAAIVSGAGGRAAEPDEPEDADDETAEAALDADADEGYVPAAGDAVYEDELDEEDDEPLEDEEEQEGEDRGAVATRGAGRPAARRSRATAGTAARAEAPARGGPSRLVAFLRASWAELQRVQWPDRRQVFQATAVVLGFVVVAGLYLGVADRVAQEVVDLII